MRGGHFGGIIEKVSFRAQVREVYSHSRLRSVREAILGLRHESGGHF